MKIKRYLWLFFALFLIPLISFEMFEVYKIYFEGGGVSFKVLGDIILLFELLLACLIAFQGDGHFPLRYLMILLLSALIFYLILNKGELSETMIMTLVGSIIALSLTFMFVKEDKDT